MSLEDFLKDKDWVTKQVATHLHNEKNISVEEIAKIYERADIKLKSWDVKEYTKRDLMIKNGGFN